MKNVVQVSTLKAVKFGVLSAAAVLLLGGCPTNKKEEPSTDGGGTGITLKGDFARTCMAVSGSPVAGGTHFMTTARYGYNNANDFAYSETYYSDSSCSTAVYGTNVSGTFTVGSATTSPAGGYDITYAVDDFVAWSAAAVGTTLSASCTTGASWSSSGSAKIAIVWGSNFSCAGMSLDASMTTAYNVFVLSGSTLSTGVPTGDNPGVSSIGAVDTTASMTFTAY